MTLCHRKKINKKVSIILIGTKSQAWAYDDRVLKHSRKTCIRKKNDHNEYSLTLLFLMSNSHNLLHILSTHVFDTTPERLWQAFENPMILKKWWWPDGFTSTFETFEFRAGGKWKLTMHSSDGRNFPNENRFEELKKFELITLEHTFTPHFELVITFDPLDWGRTQLNYTMIFDDQKTRDGVAIYAIPANEQLFERLEKIVPTL